MKKLRYCPLGFFPTPLHKLENLDKDYPDYQFFIKRDDQTGLALGGNKTRKLEYLFQDALNKGCDTVITLGAPQSNHCRQTAAAATKLGIECHLLLREPKPEFCNGNYFLDKLLGANIHWFEADKMQERQNELKAKLKLKGRKPYLIPIGGSDAVGVLGYVRAMDELKRQSVNLSSPINYIVFASCSGGTHSGMVLGAKYFDLNTKIVGINIAKDDSSENALKDHIIKISNEAARFIHSDIKVTTKDITLIKGYDEAGYGVLTEMEQKAISTLSLKEGIILDPVYSGRAFAGLLDMLTKNYFKKGSTILFWHTGGAPANFHYANQFV